MAVILNVQTSVNTPKVSYKIDAVTSNRTIDGITIKFTITSALTSSSSSLGSGSTYGINGYIKVLGTEYLFTIKGTSDKWSGTTTHTVTRTIPFTGIEPTATSITGITFRTTRTGDKDDGKIEHAGELASTKCSNITFESAHTPPSDVFYTMEETNPKLLQYGFPHDAIVENLSNKKFTIGATLYDGATVQYAFAYNRINFHRVETTDNPATVYYDFGSNEIALDDEGLRVPIAVRITDSLGSGKFNNETSELAKAWDMYDYYPYNKITLIETSTTAKRNGQTSGKVKLNVNGTFYNGFIGSINQTDGYKPTIKYKFWELGKEEPSTYDYEISSDDIIIENNTFKVINYEIGTTEETKINYFNPEIAYRVKVYVEDKFTNVESNQEKPIPIGEATWTEYKNRVDFKKITIKGNEVSYGDTGWKPFSWTNSSYVGTSQSSYTLNQWRVKDGILFIAVGVGATSTINTSSETEVARIPITGNESFASDRIWNAAVGGGGAVAGFVVKQNADYISVTLKPHTSSSFASSTWFSTFFAVPLDETAVINV